MGRTAASAHLDAIEHALFQADENSEMHADVRTTFRGLWGAYRLARQGGHDEPAAVSALLREAGGGAVEHPDHVRLRVLIELVEGEAPEMVN